MAVYGVLGMPPADVASKEAIKAAGCTHTTVVANWAALQPNGPGSALSTPAVQALVADLTQARQVGLGVMWENAIHYPPSWVLTGPAAVERFQDQYGTVYDPTMAPTGQQVANWMWTALGVEYVTDFVEKVGHATAAYRYPVDAIKTGGGWYGELHYAQGPAGINSFQGYGPSMQTGTSIAAGQTPCPLPGYVLFSGNDANDTEWLDWYLDGLANWARIFIAAQRSAGFSADYHLCTPGYGIRSNDAITTPAYQQSAALGEDPARTIAAFAGDAHVWPYCTWLNTADGYPGGTNDSDISAWKKVRNEAAAHGKTAALWGENTGGEPSSGLYGIFGGNPDGSALTSGFNGLFWLDYASLTSGPGAVLSDYAAAIRAAADPVV